MAGVERLAALVTKEAIDCGLERRAAYTYAGEASERSAVEQEMQATARSGLAVELVDAPDLPYAAHGAVRLSDQVQIHPVRYVPGLAAAVDGHGSQVFELTCALAVHEGSPCWVRTAQGNVRADHVVIATHYPFLDRGLYFARLKPQRSYCIAALQSGTAPIPCSSGKRTQHRPNRGGDRQLNHALHVIAITRANHDPATKAYLQRKEAEGKTKKGALRCLKRHLAPLSPPALPPSRQPSTRAKR